MANPSSSRAVITATEEFFLVPGARYTITAGLTSGSVGSATFQFKNAAGSWQDFPQSTGAVPFYNESIYIPQSGLVRWSIIGGTTPLLAVDFAQDIDIPINNGSSFETLQGPYANDVEAAAAGVAIGEFYLTTSGGVAYRKKLQTSLMAFGGDSITAAVSSGLYKTKADGFATYIRIYNDSKFDFVPAASTIAHGTGGITSTQFVTTYLASMIAAASPVDVFRMGTNDPGNLISVATTTSNLKACCDASRAAGHVPVVLAITPIPLSTPGNESGAMSADVVTRNASIRNMCSTYRYLFIDGTDSIATSRGNGIMAEIYAAAAGNLHPGSTGSMVLGQSEAAIFATQFEFTGTPLANTNWITPVGNFATGTSRPTGYQLYLDNDTAVESMVTDSGNTRVWQIAMSTQVGAGPWLIWNDQAISSPVGKIVDGLVRFKITSGSFIATQFTVENAARAAVLAGEMNFNNPPQVFTADPNRIYTLRTPKFTVGGGETLVAPYFLLAPNEPTNCTVRIFSLGIRQY